MAKISKVLCHRCKRLYLTKLQQRVGFLCFEVQGSDFLRRSTVPIERNIVPTKRSEPWSVVLGSGDKPHTFEMIAQI